MSLCQRCADKKSKFKLRKTAKQMISMPVVKGQNLDDKNFSVGTHIYEDYKTYKNTKQISSVIK